MNQQEIFDKVASHLITQGVRATSVKKSGGLQAPNPTCSYRGDNGTMCAAGCLIPDEEYDIDFEGCPWVVICKKIPSLSSFTADDHILISSLQTTHDWIDNWESIETLKNELRVVACDYGLSSDILRN